ncbi:Uma2 family endonuclease [Streptomyces fradiae]|uniref:Uma2 family endonuclease n=1 Tax=Streptomyces fradiae TaxID=1906 RepID=UPI003518F5CE
MTDAEILLEEFLALRTPEGLRAQLVEGEIVVTPPPEGDHEHCMSRLVRQLVKRSRVEVQVSGHKGLVLGAAPGAPKDHVIPDGTVVPLTGRAFRGAPPWMPCDGVSLVLEVTSRRHRPELDREAKRRCYARGTIPLYLLVDREERMVTLFGRPEDGEYLRRDLAPFCKPLLLPEPFGFDLDTADLH